jgi:2-keto-3-deoxy-6-phosphogluconate aldolase
MTATELAKAVAAGRHALGFTPTNVLGAGQHCARLATVGSAPPPSGYP